jgi:2-dehydro-3-deoxyphosphogalactonate aldolase
MTWADILQRMPLVAILRELTPDDAIPVAAALRDAGILCLEAPLNSPRPFDSIAAIRSAFDGELFVGAGTVLIEADVNSAAQAGAQFIVSPNTDLSVIAATKARGLHSVPGFYTPTEALAAAQAGADALKLFPAESGGPPHLKAMKAILPRELPVLAVGGVSGATMRDWIAAGAAGFGIGGGLYRPGDSPAAVGRKAAELVSAFQAARA